MKASKYLVFGALFWSGQALSQEGSCQTQLALGNPGGVDTTICSDGYAAGYSYEHKIPMWCSYWIERDTVDFNVERQDDFRDHPQIDDRYEARRSDYSGSGYDRGHCAPSASIDYSVQANSQTFYYTNMFPQLPGLNRDMFGHNGAWGFLENEVRSWARKYDRVYVISGAYVPENHTEIGAGVSVPSHFYKIVVNPNGPRIIAFWMPHEEGKKYDVKSYLTSVDEIERVTGLDFLSRVNDDQEDDLEAAIPSSLWE